MTKDRKKLLQRAMIHYHVFSRGMEHKTKIVIQELIQELTGKEKVEVLVNCDLTRMVATKKSIVYKPVLRRLQKWGF